MRILYRLGQFWRTLSIKKEQLNLEQALALLNPEQRDLFTRMQPGEQNHALTVLRRLLEQGENQPDLLVAALLHDVGKLYYRMNSLERAVVVLVKTGMPKQALHWGKLPPTGWGGLPSWHKVFILAEHHAEWGAEMARKAGASALTENLIRFHDQPHKQDINAEEISLLYKLWRVDNES